MKHLYGIIHYGSVLLTDITIESILQSNENANILIIDNSQDDILSDKPRIWNMSVEECEELIISEKYDDVKDFSQSWKNSKFYNDDRIIVKKYSGDDGGDKSDESHKKGFTQVIDYVIENNYDYFSMLDNDVILSYDISNLPNEFESDWFLPGQSPFLQIDDLEKGVDINPWEQTTFDPPAWISVFPKDWIKDYNEFIKDKDEKYYGSNHGSPYGRQLFYLKNDRQDLDYKRQGSRFSYNYVLLETRRDTRSVKIIKYFDVNKRDIGYHFGGGTYSDLRDLILWFMFFSKKSINYYELRWKLIS